MLPYSSTYTDLNSKINTLVDELTHYKRRFYTAYTPLKTIIDDFTQKNINPTIITLLNDLHEKNISLYLQIEKKLNL